MAKPTIFVFTTAYHPLIGGAEVAVQEIARRLANEFRFFIITARFRRALPPREERGEGTIIRIGIGAKFDKFLLPLWGVVRVWFLARREKPACFWAVMVSYASFIPFLSTALKARRVPTLLTLQEGDAERHIRRARFGLIAWSWRWMLERCDSLTAISTYLENLARDFGYRGASLVIPNGVDLERFSRGGTVGEKNELRRELGMAPDEQVLITVSRLEEKNAIDVLIRAFGYLRAKNPTLKVKLLVIGDGSERTNLERLARELGFAGAVVFLGRVPHRAVPRYLAIADIFCRPSRSEGLGSAFLEAMAAGVPVIATPVGGIIDFLHDRENGLFSRVDDPPDLAEKIQTLIDNPALRRRIIANAKQTVREQYPWDGIAGKFRDLFRDALARATNPRILIATGIFPPDIGGPATHAEFLRHALGAGGYPLRVITYADGSQFPPGVVPVSRRIPKGLRHFVYFWKCMKAAIAADVIYALDTMSAGLPASAAARLLGRTLYLRIVGDYAWEQGMLRFGVQDSIEDFQKRRYGWRVEAFRRLQRWVAHSAAMVIVPSRYLSEIVAGWGVADQRIEIIPNAVTVPTNLPSQVEARRLLGIPASTRLLTSVGRLVPWKGFRTLINVMPEVLRRYPDARLAIIGDGPEWNNLERAIQTLGLGDAVTLVGRVPQERLFAYLRAADLFILNTGYEGFSHQIIEAMIVGTPVLTTRSGANRELITENESGLLFGYNHSGEMVEAIGKVLGDGSLRKRLVGNALARCREFSPAVMIEQLLGAFRYGFAR